MRSRRTVRVLAALVAVTALAAGCGSDDAEARDADDTASSMSETTDGVDGGDGAADASMPDLTGLTEDEARAELADLGVDEGDVIVTPQESLLAAGTVVDTVPGSGSTITGSITLKIAGPVGPVPDFVGRQVAEVETWASDRGITLEEVAVPDSDHADGEVLGTTPEAGQSASSEIEVQVARTPSTKSLYLTEALNDAYCSDTESGEVFIDGDPYDGSATLPDDDGCVWEFDLGRDWERLTGIVGFTDSSESSTRMRVQIKVDGTSKVNQVIDFGKEPLELDVDVSDGLRLAIELSPVAGEGTIGFGDLQLLGTGPAAGQVDDTGDTGDGTGLDGDGPE